MTSISTDEPESAASTTAAHSAVPLLDVLPRTRMMLDRPDVMDRVVWISVGVGLIDGLALSLLLPTITALSTGGPVWGLGTGPWLCVLGVLAAVAFVLSFVQARVGYVVATDFIENVHRRIGDQVAKLPLGWFRSSHVGRLSRMVSAQLMQAGNIVAHMYAPLIASGVAALTVLVLSWFWDWRLGAVLTIAAPMFALILLGSSGLSRMSHRHAEPADADLASRIVEFATCQPALRSAGRSADFRELEESNSHLLAVRRQQMWLQLAGVTLGGAFTQVVIVVLIALSASLAVSGTLEPIATVAFIGLCLRFTTILTTITESGAALEDRRPLLGDFDEVLSSAPLPEPTESAPRTTPGAVELEHVTFGYHDTTVLSDVSLSIAPREIVALVGPSGSGKTTIARLVSRFYDVDAGVVRVGGTDVRQQTTADLMAQLSMVFQDVYLFDDTLEANIRIGRPDASDAEVHRAADLAGVTSIVSRLPLGWRTQVGEGGRSLSGGERQRVSIARALLKNAPIVLFDEATSALDPENEGNIMASVSELRQNATLLVIAHKLDTIRSADRIVSLTGDGRVEAIGTHSELLARSGNYRLFWDRRQQAQGWRLA